MNLLSSAVPVLAPVRGEGGALTAYQNGQFMAGLGLFAPGTQAAPAMATNVTTVEMHDFDFGPQPITVKVGATVTWNNTGDKQHSATADDGSFDTKLLDPKQSKSVTYATPGTYLYFCVLHGDKGGQGMSGTVVVEP